MIAYANGKYTYSAMMRESIKQADTPKNALCYFEKIFYKHNEMLNKQRTQEAAEKAANKEKIRKNKILQKFKEEKRNLH